jgi:signal peptidase
MKKEGDKMILIKNKPKAVISFTIAFILLSLGIVFLPLLFGYQLHFVVSDSMSPAVNKGDVVTTKMADPTEISSGDIILFESKSNQQNTLLLHRVQDKHSNKDVIQFTTKGDSNKYTDFQTVSASKVKGLYVYHIPRIGWMIDFIKDYQFYIIIFLGLSFLFINVPRLTHKSGERHEA